MNNAGSGSNSSQEPSKANSQASSSSIEFVECSPPIVNDALDAQSRSLCEQFDNFKKIGQGGFGQVYRACHKLDGVHYAIKKIKLRSLRERDQSLKEVKIMARLNHKNIVAYKNAWMERCSEDNQSTSSQSEEYSSSYQSYDTPDSDIEIPKTILCIQMELCKQNLLTLIKDRNEINILYLFPCVMVNNIGSQILKGLEYLHGLNIIHHDINPSNIFITRKSKKLIVKIGDFGLSCFSLRPTQNLIGGTVAYAAPEKFASKASDYKSDIFSFGIVLLEVLYPIKTIQELCKIKEETVNKQFPSQLYDEIFENYHGWAEVLSKSLLVDVEKRPTARELLQFLKIWFEVDKLSREKEDLVCTIRQLGTELLEKKSGFESSSKKFN